MTLKHFSASSINSFLSNRAEWFMSKFLDKPFKGSKFTARGTAVEEGINQWMLGDTESTAEAIAKAIACWDAELKKGGIVLTQQEELEFKQSIGPLVNVGVDAVYNKYIKPLDCTPYQQYKFILDVPGCKTPCIGFIDWLFDSKLVVDNKTSGKTPSSLSQSYKVQGAVYHMATGLPVEFLFEIGLKTPKTVILSMTKEDIEYGWKIFCRAARAIEFIYENIEESEFMKNFFLPNPDAFYSQEDAEAAMKEFGF